MNNRAGQSPRAKYFTDKLKFQKFVIGSVGMYYRVGRTPIIQSNRETCVRMSEFSANRTIIFFFFFLLFKVALTTCMGLPRGYSLRY